MSPTVEQANGQRVNKEMEKEEGKQTNRQKDKQTEKPNFGFSVNECSDVRAYVCN